MMDIYVIDVGAIKPGLDPEMEAMADDIQYWAYLIRGCTDNRMTMKKYLDYMNQIIGEYVELDVYQYQLDYVDTNMSEEEYIKTLEEFALVEYVKERSKLDGEHVDNIHEIPILLKLETEGGIEFISTEAMQDHIAANQMDERDTLEKVLYLFSELNKYIPVMKEPILSTFRDRLFEFFPRLLLDYYDPYAPVMLDIVYITMLSVMEMKWV